MNTLPRLASLVSAALLLLAACASPRAAHAADMPPNSPAAWPSDERGVTLRLYQAASAYVLNADGRAFDVSVRVARWNLLENGPRELLIKVMDPDGQVVARELAADVVPPGNACITETGGWDHEMWYYTLLRGRGTMPMVRWSELTDPQRVAALPAKDFVYHVPAGKKGVYRVLLAGSRDHVATLRVSQGLSAGLVGHPLWMHGHHDMLRKSYVYVPKGTNYLDLGVAEFDQPVTRTFKITAPDGEVLFDGPATGGFQQKNIPLKPVGKYDEQLLTVEVNPLETPGGDPASAARAASPGFALRAKPALGDFMLHIQLGRNDARTVRNVGGPPAIFCPDPATAKALQGGAIYHDGRVLWHPFQVRLHDWIKAHIKPEDLIVRDDKGNEIKPTEGATFGWNTKVIEYKGLPQAPGFVPLNGPHEPPPLSDQLMHHYTVHHNRAVLNVAIVDLEKGLDAITVGDHTIVQGWNGNFGYTFGTYAWHYWRPAWRILQQSDAPPELKAIVREGILLCGDRLSQAAGIERVNGNAFSHVVMALRYAREGAQDPLLTQMAQTYFDRFISEGWGRGTGISTSGDCQEHFGHDFHYGSYIHDNFTAAVNDLNDPQFKAILDRQAELYTYLRCPEATAYPWGARTAQQAELGSKGWKGEPGPDFTVSVNGGNEWFAARRPTYYALTFHGRLCPEWLDNYFATRLGYGGGTLCQLTVPGKGTVLAGTLNGSYGKDMERRKAAKFHIHTLIGTVADGAQPLVSGDSEHFDAKLVGNTVTSSGEIRDQPLHASRSFTFNADSIDCKVQLADTGYRAALWNQGPSSEVSAAYEMIPFIAGDAAKPTVVRAIGVNNDSFDLTPAANTPQLGKLAQAVVVDRGGYGVKIVLDGPRKVFRGNDTVMIEVAEKGGKPEKVAMGYTIKPFVGPAP
ncbi:MAG: hypothetical protein NTW19_14990 [Planctomycetota bacterium]|nr:hypothetical protein [Planctomycetota bacterium]